MERRDFLGRLAVAASLASGARGWPLSGGVAHGAPCAHGMQDGHAAGSPHPDPRPGVTAARVVGDGVLDDEDDEDVRAAYAAARAEPALFDGLACVCSCRETSRHRSLLVCFETRHPTACPGCLDEAILVGRLAREGRGLADVRRAVDRAFGR